MVFGIADDGDPSAVRADDLTLGDAIDGVVSSLGVNVGPDRHDKLRYRRLVKYRHIMDPLDRTHDLGPLALGDERTARAFELLGLPVGIDPNDQNIAKLGRSQQVSHVAYVKEVKTGMECGITIKNFNDMKAGDVIESYVINEVKTKLS